MEHARLRPLPARARLRPGMAALLAALAVEYVDELVDGTKSAAMPLIRHDLGLSYVQIGLLAAVPLFAGSLIEMPFGVLSGAGTRRRRFILGGGIVFIAAVLGTGLATSFAGLLAAVVIFFPASGIFVSLTQSALMDSAPGRQAQHMARWTLAGSLGAVAGPLLVSAVLAAGGTWRVAFFLIAAGSVLAWLAVAATSRGGQPSPATACPVAAGAASARSVSAGGVSAGGVSADAAAADAGAEGDEPGWPGWRAAARISRESGALRWLVLLEVADLLLDVLTAFLALYLVASTHASPAVAALGVAVRLGAGLAGDIILIQLLERLDSRRVLRASVWLAMLLLPAFLLAPGLGAKLAVLAALTIATAPWYPVLKADLFGSLPGRSGLAVSLSSASGLLGGLGPLVIGVLAERFGLDWAMASLCVVPVAMLAVPARARPDSR